MQSLRCVLAMAYFGLFGVLKLTEAAATCNQTDQQILECFQCSGSPDQTGAKKCTDSNGVERLTELLSWKSDKGQKNNTR